MDLLYGKGQVGRGSFRALFGLGAFEAFRDFKASGLLAPEA